MSSFTKPLVVTPSDSGRWILMEAFEFWSKGGETVCVPEGFVTDFASIPKFLWGIYPPYHPDYGKAAVIHDFLYAEQATTRKRADQIFLEGMQVLGCGWFRRTIIYQSVRWFAGKAWESHAAAKADKKTVADILKKKREKGNGRS